MSVQEDAATVQEAEKAIIRTQGRYPVWLSRPESGARCLYFLGHEGDTLNCGKLAAGQINDDAYCIEHLGSELSQSLLFSALLGDLRRTS